MSRRIHYYPTRINDQLVVAACGHTVDASHTTIRVAGVTCKRCIPLIPTLDPPEEDPRCSSCGGPLLELGRLGNLTHSRCRNCGADSSK